MKSIPNLGNLSQDQIEKFKDVKSMEELLKLAKDEDIEFTDEQLEFVSGGDDDYWFEAPDV